MNLLTYNKIFPYRRMVLNFSKKLIKNFKNTCIINSHQLKENWKKCILSAKYNVG